MPCLEMYACGKGHDDQLIWTVFHPEVGAGLFKVKSRIHGCRRTKKAYLGTSWLVVSQTGFAVDGKSTGL